MTAAKKLILLASITGIILSGMVLSFYMLLKASDDEINAYKNQYESYLLADEVRQSSDDLTRLARAFIVTKDPGFLDQYQAVLDIRSGNKPRPKDYHRIYWDFVAGGEKKPRPDTEKVSLTELMKRAGFSKAELAILEEAQKRSASLVKNETTAINIIRDTPPDEVDFDEKANKAQTLTHNLQYHKDKANIMEAVDQFYLLLEKRLNAQIHQTDRSRVT